MPQLDILPGTLDLLILKTLSHGALHGYGIAQYIQRISNSTLDVGEGSLYPALQRLLANGWAVAEWGESEVTGRRARFYTLNAAGRKRLKEEEREFDRMVDAIRLVLREA